MFGGFARRCFQRSLVLTPAAIPLMGRSPNRVVACEEEKEGLSEEEKRTITVFERCSPSVVHITTQLDVPTNWFEIARIDSGSGSGFIWDTNGHIVTNYHVIRNATRANVTLFDHTVLEAELVGAEPDVDVAVLRVDLGKKWQQCQSS